MTKSPDTSEPAADPTTEPSSQIDGDDPGPGWMPAIIAGVLLLGIFGFIFCAFSTWLLFQKRTELAIRTLKGAYVTELEQSLLEPETKKAVVTQIKSLAADMERGKYEDWQSAGIMQRLQRMPVIQWGELQAIEAFLQKSDASDKEDQLRQLSRLMRAVELGKVTSFDFPDLLKPVRLPDPNSSIGFVLIQPLTVEATREVALRSGVLADRAEVPDQTFENVQLKKIVGREIEQGATVGGF